MQRSLRKARKLAALCSKRVMTPRGEDPGEEALDVPAALVATKRAAVLGEVHPSGMVWSDHLDAELLQLGVEGVAVIGAVTDEALGQLLQEPLPERFDDELRFIALTTRNPDGDRKAMAVCHCHDLGRLAASSSSNKRTLFLRRRGCRR